MDVDPKGRPATEPGPPADGPGGADGDDHDLSLIVERLCWTPAQRLDANTAFLRFYLAARPEGPILTDQR